MSLRHQTTCGLVWAGWYRAARSRLGLAFVLELIDVRVRQEKDLEGIVPACVLVGIYWLRTPRGRTAIRAQWDGDETGSYSIGDVIMFGNLYTLYERVAKNLGLSNCLSSSRYKVACKSASLPVRSADSFAFALSTQEWQSSSGLLWS